MSQLFCFLILAYYYFRDTIGMTLEMEPLELAMSELVQSGWEAGSSYDPVADAELMDEDKVEAAKREERKSKSGFFTCELQLKLALELEKKLDV